MNVLLAGQGGGSSGCVPRSGCAILAGARREGMVTVSAEFITLVLGILTLAGGQIATALVLVGRMDRQADQTNQRFDGVNQRFDDVNRRFDDMGRDFADLRERMARLEGVMEGFVAGRRDRGVA